MPAPHRETPPLPLRSTHQAASCLVLVLHVFNLSPGAHTHMYAIDLTDSFNALFHAPVRALASMLALEAARHSMAVEDFTEAFIQWTKDTRAAR